MTKYASYHHGQAIHEWAVETQKQNVRLRLDECWDSIKAQLKKFKDEKGVWYFFYRTQSDNKYQWDISVRTLHDSCLNDAAVVWGNLLCKVFLPIDDASDKSIVLGALYEALWLENLS